MRVTSWYHLAQNSFWMFWISYILEMLFHYNIQTQGEIFSVGFLAFSFSILLWIASQCFLTNYLWILIHNAFLGDSSQLDSHKEMDSLVYRLLIFTSKVPVLAWTTGETKWWQTKLEVRLWKSLCMNLDLTDARYYSRLWYFLYNILRGIE